MAKKSFKDYKLSEEINRALACLNYKNPTEVQSEVIPMALEKKDLVVKSQTGSGKTASFGIPICEMVEWEENKPQALILTPTRELAAQVNNFSYPCEKIHGGMYQEDRFAVMNDFKKGDFRYLVATDVAARGIDIEHINLVINFDMPSEKESYVHRIGRTGRAGKTGKAITLITENEEKYLAEIEDYVRFQIPIIDPPSKEAIQRGKAAFEEKIKASPAPKEDKNAQLNQDIMKLYFNGGKKKKIRAVDFVGTIAKIEGVSAEDIGIITIHENESFVEILNGKGPIVLQAMKKTTVKGKRLKVHKAIE
ncbi:MAG TPA: DEAD/DEAH box helicase [Bacillus bacterium]|nr:DEAD/DEAH box helicase [Bacillus sp. (in: firmicutes)]